MNVRFSYRERIIFVLCLLSIFIYWNYMFVYKPAQEKRSGIQDKVLVAQKQLKRDMRTVAQAKAYQGQYDKILAEFKQSGTDEAVMSAILSEIERASAGFKVKIAEMKPQRVKKSELTGEFSVSMTLEGSLSEVIRCLHTLQQPPHLFGVSQLRIERQMFQGVDLQCQLILSRIFFL